MERPFVKAQFHPSRPPARAAVEVSASRRIKKKAGRFDDESL